MDVIEDREQNFVEEVKNFFSAKCYQVEESDENNLIFSKFTFFEPDVKLLCRNKLLAAIECKGIDDYNHFYITTAYNNLKRYCLEKEIPYALIITNSRSYLLSEYSSYEIKAYDSYHDAFDIIDDRVTDISDVNPQTLKEKFLSQMKKIAGATPYLGHDVNSRIDSITLDNLDWNNIKVSATSITVSDSFERTLFMALLGNYDGNQICRYTTKASLSRIISDKKQSLCSIVGMNDKSECYYAHNYLKRNQNGELSNLSRNEIGKLNEFYITSCTSMENCKQKMEDNLSMWRLYASDCEGVCMVFDIDKGILRKGDYILGPISYAQRVEERDLMSMDDEYSPIYKDVHPELDFIRGLIFCKVGGYTYKFPTLELWLHFFKSYDYRDEQEVRLLYKGSSKDKRKWIVANNIYCPVIEKDICDKNTNEYPLILKRIILGPKFSEQNVNVAQIALMVRDSKIVMKDDFDCELSEINNYR